MFITRFAASGLVLAGLLVGTAAPAVAQEAGDTLVRLGVARTKLVDKGSVYTNGVLDPAADYETRDTIHGVLTVSHFVLDSVALDASISSPATTDNMPAGSLAGLPNLGDDEFVVATLGASLHLFRGPISPYVGGGLQFQLTTQERDALAVNLNIPNANGPYVKAGIDFAINDRVGLFVEGRKAFYHTNATGLLPLDATYTSFANVDARAQLDPLTIQIGVTARLGGGGRHRDRTGSAIGEDRSRLIVKAGFTSLTLADEVDLQVGGAAYPGTALSTYEHQTLSAQLGYFILPNLAVNATLGLPPTIDVFGAGSIGALPRLGKVTYGPTMLTLQYHPLRSGRIRPYAGLGVSYMIVFDTKDGAFKDLRVDNDLGAAFEMGTEIMVGDRSGIFFDVKKALLRPKTYGSFGGAPVEGETRLDPWAVSGGVAFHF